jgi:hypothetical protein
MGCFTHARVAGFRSGGWKWIFGSELSCLPPALSVPHANYRTMISSGRTTANQRINSVGEITCPVHQPEERQGKQGTHHHRQPRQKPDLFLMSG